MTGTRPAAQRQPPGTMVDESVSVRDIVDRQDEYIADHLGLANVDRSVLQAITQVDQEPLHFLKITVKQSGVRSDAPDQNYTYILLMFGK